MAKQSPGPRWWALLPLALASCTTYVARPLDTADPVARYQARRLDDPALAAVLDSLDVHPSPAGWRDWDLAAAAWVMRPERPRVLAEISVAEAARLSADARPSPGLATEAEYAFNGAGSEPRFGLALAALFTIETGGKHGARIARAEAAVLAAMARAAEEAWEIRWRVRTALSERETARRRWETAVAELALSDSVVGLMRARYQEGAVPKTEVARTQADREEWAAEVAARVRDLEDKRVSLAIVIGVPMAEVERTPVRADSARLCPQPAGGASLERTALESRRELYRVLAEYQVAEGDVRVEVARSWPDVTLGPGLFFDHGVNKWTIAFGLPSLLLHGNRGPIREVEARREVAARRVAEMQEQVIGQVEQAITNCATAVGEVAALDVSGARLRAELAERAYQRGEIGRLEVVGARLELARASRRMTDSAARLLSAGLDFERAMGIWTGVSSLPRPEKGEL